jgi:hypothetical protein
MTPRSKSASTSALSILTAIRESKLGFQFGKPQRLGDNALSCVLPILRETSVKRQYVTFPETDKVSVTDSGSISKMKVSSVSTDNVFIRSGTIFKGGTQERTIVRSAIIFPGATLDIEVRCVHATRGISPGAKVGYGGITNLNFDSANYSDGFVAKNQHETWNNVQHSTSSMLGRASVLTSHATYGSALPMSYGSSRITCDSLGPSFPVIPQPEEFVGYAGSPSQDLSADLGLDDLHTAQAEFAKNFDAILSKITPVEHQAGIALINHAGCQTIETFDVGESWLALHTDAVKRVGAHPVNQDDSVFEYKPENAVRAVQSVLAQEYTPNLIYEHKPSNGEPYVAIHGLTSKDFIGEVVELDNRVIHLLLTKRA